MTDQVLTVSDVVAALGGRHAVASRCEVSYSAVSNWCVWNAFPKRLYLALARAYREAEKGELPEYLFDRETAA